MCLPIVMMGKTVAQVPAVVPAVQEEMPVVKVALAVMAVAAMVVVQQVHKAVVTAPLGVIQAIMVEARVRMVVMVVQEAVILPEHVLQVAVMAHKVRHST